MTRRHHRNPRTLQEFIDATADHLEEDWNQTFLPLFRVNRVPVKPKYELERRGKLAQRHLGQPGNDSEQLPAFRFKFRIRLDIEAE